MEWYIVLTVYTHHTYLASTFCIIRQQVATFQFFLDEYANK